MNTRTANPDPRQQRALKILLVDDERSVCLTTSLLLELDAHSVVCAFSAREAIHALASATFDLLITDYSMPEITGLQLIEHARINHPRLPVIMATAYSDLLPGSIPGLSAILTKPFTLETLRTAIKSVFDKN